MDVVRRNNRAKLSVIAKLNQVRGNKCPRGERGDVNEPVFLFPFQCPSQSGGGDWRGGRVLQVGSYHERTNFSRSFDSCGYFLVF